MAKRRALDLGLQDLLSDASGVYGGGDLDSKKVVKVRLDSIKPNPKQPRLHFSESEIKELAESMREYGLVQPVVVSVDSGGAGDSGDFSGDSSGGGYVLVAGERRLRAAKSLGWEELDSIIIDVEAHKMRELALIENIQRQDLNAIELALCFKALLKEHNLTHENLAKKVGKSRAFITNTMRLLSLSEKTQNLVREGKITQGHALRLVGLNTEDESRVADEILQKHISVRDVERMRSGRGSGDSRGLDSGVSGVAGDSCFSGVSGGLDSRRLESVSLESGGLESGSADTSRVDIGKSDIKKSDIKKTLEILKNELGRYGVESVVSEDSITLRFEGVSKIHKLIHKLRN